MKSRNISSVTLAAMLAVCGGVAWVEAQNQPGQPSQPSQNDPGRTNPNQPGKTNPNDPGRTNPNQPGRTNPNDPGRTNPNDPGRTDPGNPSRTTLQPGGERNNQPGDRMNQPGLRSQRPFAFQSPDMETRFNESGRRLVGLERRMEDNNRELMRKLSEARSMTGAQQNQAVLDILQQMLQEQQQLHQYLVQARTGWTGDIEGIGSMDSIQRDGTDQQRRTTDPSRPSNDATPRNPR